MSASLDLARRAVACNGWRWMPGMLGNAQPAGRWSARVGDIGCAQDARSLAAAGALPDLDDPATLGCLLALVREAWGDPHIYVRKSVTRGEWVAWRKLRHDDECAAALPGRFGVTEAEALVAALEAAP